ncbi:MAG: FMN-binding protein [Candidatus Omnitrophota bacterium]
MNSRIILLLFLSFIGIFLSSCAAHRTHFMDTLNLKGIKDGTYIGEDTVVIPPCSVKLATTVKDGKIADIKILSHIVSYPLAGRAYDILPKRIIERQSLDVDAVTAATVSTNNIKRAVLKALEKAKQ